MSSRRPSRTGLIGGGLIAVVSVLMLSGCRSPELLDPGLNPDRVVVMENGERLDLLRIVISVPAFPTGYPADFLSERAPAPDAGSLHRFMRECPPWRDLGELNQTAVAPLRQQFPWVSTRRKEVVLSIHPVVLGVAAEEIPGWGSGRHQDRLVRPVDFVNSVDSVRITRLVHARHFPTRAEVDRVYESARGVGELERQYKLLGQLLDARVVELETPLTIEEAMRYIESHEEFHRVHPEARWAGRVWPLANEATLTRFASVALRVRCRQVST